MTLHRIVVTSNKLRPKISWLAGFRQVVVCVCVRGEGLTKDGKKDSKQTS